jgi:heat shock protein HslJ
MSKALIKNVTLLATLAIVVSGGLMFAGCSSSDNDPPAALYNIWQLQEFILDDGTTTPVDDPAKYTVEFRTDGTDAIRADCNNCGGNFTADESSLRFGPQACTIAQCAAGSFDTQFQAALGSVSGYELTPALLLDYEGGVMRFIPQPTLF